MTCTEWKHFEKEARFQNVERENILNKAKKIVEFSSFLTMSNHLFKGCWGVFVGGKVPGREVDQSSPVPRLKMSAAIQPLSH
jgi:hypothetical protein